MPESGGVQMGFITRAVAAACCFLASLPVLAQALPDGEVIYFSQCASCHELGIGNVPDRDGLGERAPEYIENMLTTWSMRTQGELLSHPERRAVATWLARVPASALPDPRDLFPPGAYCQANIGIANPLAGPAWNGWSPGVSNSRTQSAAAAGLTAAGVRDLELKWAFGVPGVDSVGSQVSVVGERVFVGARNGMVYSLDRQTGCIEWTFEANGGVRSTPVVATEGDRPAVYFGDAFANFYALDALTGEQLWRVKADAHTSASVTGPATLSDGRVYVPIAALEEARSSWPLYECCTFRGSMLVLDAETGDEVWRARTIAPGAEPIGENRVGTRMWGPSGVGVWGAPAIDPASGRAFIGTGNQLSEPATIKSNAVIAFNAQNGEELWSQQTTVGDIWNVACLNEGDRFASAPEECGPDYDFGAAPVFVTRADGQDILLAGQKSGVIYAFDPDSGDLLWERQAGAGGVLGGIEWGFAADSRAAYVSISEVIELEPGDAGGLMAIDLMDGSVLWEALPSAASCDNRIGCSTAQPGAVSAMPGVVFSGSVDGHVRAYDAMTGEVIWDYDTVRQFDTVNGVPAIGGALNGPGASIAGGMVFVGSGYSSFGMMPGNVILAFGADD